jgi:ATP-dependent DNA helicase DinG
LRERLQYAEREILVQGEDFSRQELMERFVSCGNAVLIGTSSFWTGIDVPGAALSQLILTRLPFANPREPLVEARGEWIAENGGKPFFEMSVPDAILQFRQGIGRLIRKSGDCGRVVILDSRMLNKTYGKRFIAALPHAKYSVFTAEDFRDTIPPFTR